MVNLVFLLGSGASRPAELPMVPEITSQVLSGANVVRHSTEAYYISPSPNPHFLVDPELVRFVAHLRDRIAPFFAGYKPSRAANYEDIAYVARQLADSIDREYENPALAPFIEELRIWLGANSVDRVWRMADEATKYIRGVVCSMVGSEPKRTDYLKCLIDACRDRRSAHVTLASLNHDRVLEVALGRADIPFWDGFVGPDGDAHVFSDHFPPSRGPHLLKLHGSVDWFRYQTRALDGHGKRSIFVRSSNPEKWHLRDGSGRELGPPADSQAQVLVGTFSKIFDYTHFVFVDLQARLHQALKAASTLVIIGYGFQDKAINGKMIHFMDADAHRRTVIIDPNPEFLTAGRLAAQANVQHWLKNGRVRVVPQGVETVNLEEVLGE